MLSLRIRIFCAGKGETDTSYTFKFELKASLWIHGIFILKKNKIKLVLLLKGKLENVD